MQALVPQHLRTGPSFHGCHLVSLPDGLGNREAAGHGHSTYILKAILLPYIVAWLEYLLTDIAEVAHG